MPPSSTIVMYSVHLFLAASASAAAAIFFATSRVRAFLVASCWANPAPASAREREATAIRYEKIITPLDSGGGVEASQRNAFDQWQVYQPPGSQRKTRIAERSESHLGNRTAAARSTVYLRSELPNLEAERVLNLG